MARTKTTAAPKTETKATRKPRTKKAETPAAEPTPAPVEYTPKELELKAKFPHQDLVPGSYRVAGAEDRPGWGHKHTVLVRCTYPGGCDSEPIVRATSDLWFTTTCFCARHGKAVRANRRATAKAKKELK